MLIGLLLGVCLSGGTSLCLGAVLLAKLDVSLARAERAALAFVLGSACYSLVLFLLCALHLAYTGAFAALFIAAGIAAWRLRKKSPGAALPGLPRRWTWFFGLLFGAYAVVYLVNALAPEMSPDGAAYHLPLVARSLRAHGFERITWNFYASLPQGIELLFLPAFALGRDSAAAMVHFLFLLDLPLLMFCHGRRFGFPVPAAAAAFLVFASPLVGLDGTSAYVDVAAAAVLFALVHLLALWEAEPAPRLLVPIGMLAGFALAAKYTAAIAIPYALGVILWRLGRARRPLLRPALLVSALAALFVLPWMIKNAVFVSNPLAPFANRQFPNPYVHVSFEREYRANLRHYVLTGPAAAPLELTLKGERLQGFFGPVFLLMPLALLSAKRRHGRRLLLAGAVFALPWFLNIGTRFLIPALPPFALALALALERPAALLPALSLLHAVLSWYAAPIRYFDPYAPRLDAFPWRAALRLEPEDAYLSRRTPGYLVDRMIERIVPPGESVLSLASVPEAWTARRILVAYQSARNQTLADMLGTALRSPPALQALEFRFAERSVRRLRAVQTAPEDGHIWSVSEFQVWCKGQPVLFRPGWVSAARPNPWEAALAFDGNLATRWQSWQNAAPGMFLEIDFAAPQSIDEVRLLSTADARAVHLQVDESGEWRTLPVRPSGTAVPAPDLRAAATRALIAGGIHYLLVPPTAFGASGFYEEAAAWGMQLVGESAGARLYRLTGNPASTPVALAPLVPVPAGAYDDTDPRIRLHAAWIRDTQFPETSQHTLTYSNIRGASATLAFTGTAVSYVYTRASNRGIAEVRIDGSPKCRIDLYSAATRWQSRTRLGGLTQGAHVFQILVTGQKNPLASDTFVDLDALFVE